MRGLGLITEKRIIMIYNTKQQWPKLPNSRGNGRPYSNLLSIDFMRCCPSQIFRSIEEKLFLLDFSQNIFAGPTVAFVDFSFYS